MKVGSDCLPDSAAIGTGDVVAAWLDWFGSEFVTGIVGVCRLRECWGMGSGTAPPCVVAELGIEAGRALHPPLFC